METLRRIGAVVLRYLYLHKRSLPRTLEIVFWPVMELLVWGFVSVYFQKLTGGAGFVVFLINAMIFWDILYRSQQGVSISIIEDIWTQNIVNVLVSPLKIWEWLFGSFIYGLLKISLITLILSLIAFGLYHYNLIDRVGLYLVPLGAGLLCFGWALGVFTSALVIRWGYAAEALIWGVPFLVQPVSAIFYPLSILPPALQAVARCLPSTYVFEGMRAVVATGTMAKSYFIWIYSLNLFYFVVAGIFFKAMYGSARETGRLGRLGMD